MTVTPANSFVFPTDSTMFFFYFVHPVSIPSSFDTSMITKHNASLAFLKLLRLLICSNNAQYEIGKLRVFAALIPPTLRPASLAIFVGAVR